MLRSESFSFEHCPCWENLLGNTLCSSCLRRLQKSLLPRSLSFDLTPTLELRSMSLYDSAMKDYIYLCKTALFNGLMPTQKNLLKELCRFWASEYDASEFDVIVPVPGNPFRNLMQSDLAWHLARYMARELSLGEPQSLLKRRFFVQGRLSASQKMLSKVERHKLIRQQYYLPQAMTPKRVLLVDDVCTTGSSLRYCSELLEAAGYRVHSTLVLARVPERVHSFSV